ncbi:four helix bundle protein [Flavobacterium sp.]|uniref:four helix bundle protein n=1 Tax=Flavobacterium sp. TaxID=239 RepID=UPI0008BE908E|nr:four helix bundle protein [Flavobacterium sp.]OGS62545.1 MAG: four helix bundle protein [Flavobacteria bacterium GWF1_32_7]HBD25527.1 four helix bundle protein [Flavobacterium sp.]
MNHKDLDVWKKSMDLVEDIYALSKFFPDDEKFGLTNQIRRASVSVPSNISEGAARKSDKEFIQFLYIALGSLSELETQYLIAVRLKYIIENKEIENKINEVKKMMVGLRNYLLKK